MDINALHISEGGEILAITPQTQCYNCHLYGHISSQCPKKGANQPQGAVHVVGPSHLAMKKKPAEPLRGGRLPRDPKKPAEVKKRFFRRVINQLGAPDEDDSGEELFEEVYMDKGVNENEADDPEDEPSDF